MALKFSKAIKNALKNTFYYIILTSVAFIMAFPFFWMVSTSLKRPGDIFILPIKWFPNPVIIDQYINIWRILPFKNYCINSVIVSLSIVVGSIFICSLAAFGFTRINFPGRDKIFVGYLALLMIPIHVTIIPLFIMSKAMHLVNNRLGIIIPGLFNVYGTFLLRQFFITIPKDLDDAARIDGCGYWMIYWKIIIPNVKPAMATLGIFLFNWSWNNFLWPMVLISTETKKTLPVGLAVLKQVHQMDWTVLMTGTTIAILPILMVFIINQRFITQGVVLSGLKE